ncbi:MULTISPECIES: hypothetical protein [unclassified Chryseobacterium]|uniref:hypothetical protein n=1 Tax=unclassified Chryseobacterium TaxID=2593645 RepID=UPI003015E599
MDNKGKKRGLQALTKAGSNLKETTEKIKEEKPEFSTENNIIFSFNLNKDLLLYIKQLRIFKIHSDLSHYLYNESDAVREGIQLLKKAFPNISQRPDEIKNPAKAGRGAKSDPNIIRSRTSFAISEADVEFVYNFIYDKQKGGDRYTKEEFFCLLVEHLEKKYKIRKLEGNGSN